MAIRVTQSTMYNSMVSQMQKNLSDYMASNEQGATQKRINRPSDDPAGTYRVLTSRNTIADIEQRKTNADTALGWLQLTDNVLATQVPNVITGLKSLAEQASTGTYTAEQRKLMADEARAYWGQLLNLANTEFEGRQLFAGHRYDKSAFEEGMGITTWDEGWEDNLNAGYASVTGTSPETIMVQFTGGGGDIVVDTTYRWSNDGGKTWDNQGKVSRNAVTNDLELTAGGTIISLKTRKDPNDTTDTIEWSTEAYDEALNTSANNGTTLYIRPGAYYQGDHKDPPPDVTIMTGPADLPVKAVGDFGTNVLVRMDEAVNLESNGQPFTWSYSTDGGANWITAKGQTSGDPANNIATLRLPIPGGYLEMDATNITNKTLSTGTQVMVHPSRADLEYEILEDTYIDVNNVGKDVFGGIYNNAPALEGSSNLLEVVGSFIGYLEWNNQEGCQRTLAALTAAEEHILSQAARVGGLENRVSLAQDVLDFQKLDQQERLSYVEDIDLTELLTRLTRQQLTYQTVLQSSSMIMNLSLANYV
ncbi:MAG: flagellar hook protein [Desulfovibrio sp.]|nr:flagellar hook protein [Desulfovibrio sp.]